MSDVSYSLRGARSLYFILFFMGRFIFHKLWGIYNHSFIYDHFLSFLYALSNPLRIIGGGMPNTPPENSKKTWVAQVIQNKLKPKCPTHQPIKKQHMGDSGLNTNSSHPTQVARILSNQPKPKCQKPSTNGKKNMGQSRLNINSSHPTWVARVILN